MLSEVIGDLLPSAFAVALSPIPVVAIVLVLGAPRARTRGPAFALGWIGGLLAVSIVVVVVLGAGSDPDSDDPGVSWLKVGIGVLFLVLAAGQWKKRPKDGQPPEQPSWMATIDSATPAKAAVLGAALSAANPKNLALTLAAAASIAEAGLDQADEAIAIAVFVALGSATVAGAVLFYLVDAKRAARPFDAIKRFMADNNAAIMTVVLLLLGASSWATASLSSDAMPTARTKPGRAPPSRANTGREGSGGRAPVRHAVSRSREWYRRSAVRRRPIP